MVDLDLKGMVCSGMKKVFSTMLSMELVEAEGPGGDLGKGSPKVVSSVSFAGKAMGCVNVHVGADFAKSIAAAMLGMDQGEIEGDEEVQDVMGEIGNMIGGYLKSRFCDSGLPCELSIPSVTSGTDFKVEAMNWDVREGYSFQHGSRTVFTEIFMKSFN
jgi:CheY-specific phosphatase CheX